MPKRRQTAPARPSPIQLSLFAEAASLIRVRPSATSFAITASRSGPIYSVAHCCSANGGVSAPKAASGSIRILIQGLRSTR
jgi:hypothetical protein